MNRNNPNVNTQQFMDNFEKRKVGYFVMKN